MAQYLVPVEDVSTGSWTPAPLFSNVDDNSSLTAAGDNVAITSETVTNNGTTSFAELRLGIGLAPTTGTKTLRVRWNHTVSGRSLQAICELWSGIPGSGTLLHTMQSATNVGTTEVEQTATVTVSDEDITSGNLYVRIYGLGTGGGAARALRVEFVELAVPDAFPWAMVQARAESLGWTTVSQDATTYIAEKDGVRIKADSVANEVKCSFVAGFLSWEQSTFRSHDLSAFWADATYIDNAINGMETRMRPYVGNRPQ